MKLSLVVIGFLAIVCLSLSEAAEESNSLIQNNKEISNNRNIIHLVRENRSAEKKGEKKGNKKSRKGKKKANKKSRKGKKKGNKKSRKGKKEGNKKSKKGMMKGNKKSRKGKKKGNEKSRKGKKNGNKKARKGNKQPLEKERKIASNDEVGSKTRSKVSGRKTLIGAHCQYVDLCLIDRMSEDGCTTGQKFVIKSPKGTRRQFLMVDGSKIIAFLINGKKITDCGGNLTDVTSKVSCKTVAGAGSIKLQRQNGTNETTSDTTVAAPAPVPAPEPAPAPAPESATEAPVTDSMPPLEAGQFHCPCPTRTCFTKITSTNNKHKIECGSSTFNVPCGGSLMGSKIGLLISIIDVFEQPLCSTNTYVTLIKDLVWKCSDLNIPEDGPCEEDETSATTVASDTMEPGPTDMPPGPSDMPSMAPIVNDTMAPNSNATLPPNPTAPANPTVGANPATTTASAATIALAGTTTTASSATTTTASATTTTASATTTTASSATTTASATTTTTASATTTITASTG